jgi:hypothetical protein
MPVKKQSELGAILERLKKSESSAYLIKNCRFIMEVQNMVAEI